MAKGRKRPASAIEEDRSGSAPLANGMAPTTTAAGGSDGGGGPNALEHCAKNNEVKFGKHLASSDKRVRDRTVGALREWLRQRSRGGSLTDLDLLKIWRGLWYCMFMCDKAPVQRELAENLAGLLSLFKDDRAEGVRFFKSFCVTMQRDWERIDNLRIDKYYTLVRVFVREALAFCRLPPQAVEGQPKQKRKKKGKNNSPAEEAETSAKAGGVWDLGLLGAMSEVMEVEILTPRPAPIGLRLHLADVWAEEACNAGGADMPTEAFLVALAPWLRLAAEPETNPVVFRRTFEGVFEGLLGLFPEDKDGMEEEEEEEKKVFAAVELDRVQACLFEVAAAPQTRDKRRVKLYELHRRYQKRTGVAPDASAPPSGILPLPDESDDDDDEDEEGGGDGEYDGEYVEAGARRRAVRGPEPAVAGWVAAGIASGDISLEGGAEGGGKKAKKRRKRSGSEDDEAEVNGGGEKKRRTVEEEEEASAKKKKKSRGSVEKDSAEAAAAGAPAAAPAGVEAGAGGEAEAVTPGKKSTKKRKKEEASPPGGASNGAVTMEGTVVAAAAVGDGVSSPPSSGKRKKKKKRGGSADGVATVVGDDAAAAVSTATVAAPEAGAAAGNGGDVSSPPRSGKRKKNKERVSADGVATDASDVAAAAVSLATAAAPEAEAAAPADGVEESPSSGKKKKKKGKGEEEVAMPDEGESETTPEDDVTTTQDSSSEKKKKKKKKKKKRPSLEAVASPTPPPGNTASEEDSAPSSGSFQTPPKNAGGGGGSSSKKKKKSPAAGESASASARKTVTFGANMAKEHQTSVKDLRTRVITPSKDAGTPQKGLLKVGGGGSGVKLMKPAAGRKDTPFAGKKKASDYF